MKFKRIINWLDFRANDFGIQYLVYGWFGLLNFPFSYIMWTKIVPQGYESFSMRLIATFLCLGLILRKYWPEKYRSFFGLYWLGTLTYSVVYLPTFYLLKDNFSLLWQMSYAQAILVLVLLVSWELFFICLSIGVFFAVLTFWILNFNSLDFSLLSDVQWAVVIYMFAYAVLIGGIFSRNRQLTEARKRVEEKLVLQEQVLMQKESFAGVAAQVAHDIRSPLAALVILAKSCIDIPEKERVSLREIATSINDIANNLLIQYQKQEVVDFQDKQQQDRILVAPVLLQLLSEKKLQYQNLSVKFTPIFSQQSYFSFIKIEPTVFKRMISNLINNAVDAFDKKSGEVMVYLDVSNEWVNIVIQDNGKGMAPELVAKIKQGLAVTEGKADGHGIGLVQVREALRDHQGEFDLMSQVGQGTKMVLIFPRLSGPSWLIEEIKLNKDDLVVILDDDHSIHAAWDAHFSSILEAYPLIELKHFKEGREALNYIDDLSVVDKKRVFLLTDYELLKQELNGLQVIVQAHVDRSVLVTSHYADKLIIEGAMHAHTKILPKLLAAEIPITINQEATADVGDRWVDLVIVDDQEAFLKILVGYSLRDKKVDCYYNPFDFLQKLKQYPKDTKICLDYDFNVPGINGIDLAQQLHNEGYSKLYMISGMAFKAGELPEYLTVVSKAEIDKIIS